MEVRAYQGSFRKKNGDLRDMIFVKMEDLPDYFLDERVQGTGSPRTLAEGMQTVWDVEAEGFRTFNWNTVEGKVKAVRIEDF